MNCLKSILIFFFYSSVLSGCASTRTLIPQGAQVTLTSAVGDEAQIGTYISSWKGFRTSSYWINAPGGLIFIDTQFLTSAAEESIEWAEKVTGKKTILAIVLHPNPDKFNGTAVFQKRGVRVITSQQVLDKIPSVHKLRMGWFYERYKPDYPQLEPKPQSFGNATQALNVAGVMLKLHVLGAGCSDEHVVVEFAKHLFTGDLVTQGFHSWLELGLIDSWIKRIHELKLIGAETIHTGRGASGEADLLDRQEQYLVTVKTIVEKYFKKYPLLAIAPLSEELAEKILTEITDRYPAYDYPLFVENGLVRVWDRLRQK